MLNRAVLFVKIAFWIACIVFGFLCLIPTAYLPSVLFDWWDKAQHVFTFLCLSSLGILAYQKAVVKVAIGLLIYGALIEALQWSTGWRSGELADWAADGIGILIGCPLINKLIQKRSIFSKSWL
ncbi:VanZ family protein [Polynucleobacter sp. AP-Reno-20A-A9]|uniref:VanZ family protein n=1 Tax=Polynucleobacter sp. AP-Reno-20A-A9 TaxID=2576925 RepID=UPI001C0E5A6D|nr:VanZ family protein [Polynucleobacter sp. AP-Reno-20A-A9]MBU3629308.1 VanZ family protein [Polynucleobacter sp. AP-Reno-20A-A9]